VNLGNIPPSILRSINAQQMQWKVALGEACDNSFDSEANWVRIVFHGQKQVEIIDDGNGCDNIEAMLTIGKHYRQANTRLGRFGVGLKELACWLWGELVIHTISGGVMRKAAVDWERLARAADWNVPDPTACPVQDPQQRGTRLLFRRTGRNRPGDLAALADELGYLFAPALWNGKQIAIESGSKKLTVAAWKLPEFEGEVVRESFLVNGKRVQLTAGVVASDHVNPRKGFTFIHEFRVLLNSAMGSGGKSVSRICGTVDLGPEWKLGKNKDAIQDSDDQMAALEHAIYTRCEELLGRGERQSMILRNSAFEGAVTNALRGLLCAAVDDDPDRKAKRKAPENQTGRVEPTGKGRRHKRAKNQQPGQTFKGKASLAGIRFEWESRQDGMIGRADLPGNVVYLNDNHRRLIHHRENENVDAIADLCCVILSDEVIRNRESTKLPIVRDYTDITSAISEVLRRQQETDDRVAVLN
jgi:hypothetical protein